MNRFTTVIAIFTLALIQQTAHADAGSDEPRTVTVRFSDLNLDHTPGAAALYQRLKHAADLACSPLQGGDAASKARFAHCADQSVAASIAKIDRPMLTQYYRTITDGRNAPVLLVKR
jgi:UrcA family protein